MVDREISNRIECYMRRLPRIYSKGDRARVRVLTNTIYHRGAGLEEALEMARRQVAEKPTQSIVEDLHSRFWERPSASTARVLAMLAERRKLASDSEETGS